MAGTLCGSLLWVLCFASFSWIVIFNSDPGFGVEGPLPEWAYFAAVIGGFKGLLLGLPLGLVIGLLPLVASKYVFRATHRSSCVSLGVANRRTPRYCLSHHSPSNQLSSSGCPKWIFDFTAGVAIVAGRVCKGLTLTPFELLIHPVAAYTHFIRRYYRITKPRCMDQ